MKRVSTKKPLASAGAEAGAQEVEDAEACRCLDKSAEATDVVFRLVKRDSNVHRCGHANSVPEHNKPHTSTGVEAGVEKTVKNVIVWPSTDAGRPGLAS